MNIPKIYRSKPNLGYLTGPFWNLSVRRKKIEKAFQEGSHVNIGIPKKAQRRTVKARKRETTREEPGNSVLATMISAQT